MTDRPRTCFKKSLGFRADIVLKMFADFTRENKLFELTGSGTVLVFRQPKIRRETPK
jgi:hypothetical protein